MDTFDVVILGAGYAGLLCAARLSGQMRGSALRIALISRHGHFVERLRLHEGLADPGFVPPARLPRLERLLGPGCELVRGEIRAIDRAGCAVEVDAAGGPRRISYGQLVVALGSRTAANVPGMTAHAYVLEAEGPRGQAPLKERLASLTAPRIIVVGGGATGIEAAGELARIKGARVTLLDSGVFGAFATPAVRRRLMDAARRAGITVRAPVRVTGVEEGHVTTADGRERCDVCVWCAGFAGQPAVLAAGLDADASGRIRVDPYLRSLSDARVFAAGDACVPVEACGAPPRMSAFFALATGAHVADTLARVHRGRRPRPFGFWTYGQAITVGNEAVGFATLPYDRQVGPIYQGRTAVRLRSFFVGVLAGLIALAPRWPSLPFWLGRQAGWRGAGRQYAPPGTHAPGRAAP